MRSGGRRCSDQFDAVSEAVCSDEVEISSRSSPNSPANGIETGSSDEAANSSELVVKKLSDHFLDKPNDVEQLSAVKETLHVSTTPYKVVYHENEQKWVLEFCKQCTEQEKAESLYVCGCPGTGKSVSMESV